MKGAPNTLEYSTPKRSSQSTAWRWIIPITLGTCFGTLLSHSAAGVVCAAPVCGFIIGFVIAAFTTERKIAFGLFGCAIAGVVCCTIAAVQCWWDGNPRSLTEWLVFVLLLNALVMGPGFIGVETIHLATHDPDR